MNIISGKIEKAQKVIIYGPEGIGKTTFASQFPDPLFIDTEGSTYHLDVKRVPTPSSWTMIFQILEEIKQEPTVCKTVVVDTADWAEKLCIAHICAKNQKNSIEDFGYGKGYTYLAEEFGKLLNKLQELIDIDINVVITAHAFMRKFEQPDEIGAYDRWELKLQKKTAPMCKEWADMVLFANYKAIVVNVDNNGAQNGKNKVQGGKRVMYTTHHSCWDAKNRESLKPELPFDYKEVAHLFKAKESSKSQAKTKPKVEAKSEPKVEPKPEVPVQKVVNFKYNQEIDGITDEIIRTETKPKAKVKVEVKHTSSGIPQALKDLMEKNKVHEFEIQSVVARKGYYPQDTEIKKYDINFINGVLIGAWDQVFGMIKEDRENVPF